MRPGQLCQRLTLFGSLLLGLPALSMAQGREATGYRIFPSIISPSGGLLCGGPNNDLIFTAGVFGGGASGDSSYSLWCGFAPPRRITVLCPDPSDVVPSATHGAPTGLVSFSPNPTSGPVHMTYDAPSSTIVCISIYDASGRSVKSFNHRVPSPGHHQFTWDGRDEHDMPVASGVYFVKVRSGMDRAAQTVVIIRK